VSGTRAGFWFLIVPVAMVVLLGGCVYYNGMYNTNRLANSARRAEREGRTFAATSLWGQVATKANPSKRDLEERLEPFVELVKQLMSVNNRQILQQNDREVLAACGVRVAKHGNRSVSSTCGSADLFEALGVRINAEPDIVERCLDEAGIAFFFAPTFHPSMRHAGPTRKDLGVRTAFNLLGPLTNPAGASRQLVGVPRPELTELVARSLGLLGSERAWVVHGADGLDEISTTGYTKVSECRGGAVNTFYVHPSDFGLPKASPAQLRGGDASANADIARAILGGELEAFAAQMHAHFSAQGDASWQLELQLKGTGKTLHARGARLPQATGGGAVVVFDDITRLIQAQRATAWAEVARRLAHEIKNPLTPIQLSAERLEMKLGERLSREDADILRRATETIVHQVSALKAMVDDFRDYARMPAPEPAPLDLNALVRQVLALYENSSVPIAKHLAEGLPAVWADGAQIRQVIHNLVQNAQDSHENARQTSAAIEVRTELAGDKVRMAVSDHGGGFPEELMARIFEPYVTTKPRGTGLGLAIVKKIVDEHHGSVAIENVKPHGAKVSIDLPQRTDAGPRVVAAG